MWTPGLSESFTRVDYWFLLLLVSAIHVSDISLKPVIQNPNTTHEGVVLLKNEDDAWYSVCKDGKDKNWGKKEAMVACRQLHYEGGWPIDVDSLATEYSNQSFVDFDCSWRKYNCYRVTKGEEIL